MNFKNLPILWQIIIALVLFFVIALGVSWIAGKLENKQNTEFDNRMVEKMQQVELLEKENAVLREERKVLIKERLELDAQVQVYEKEASGITQDIAKEQEKLDEALLEMDEIEAKTNIPVQNYVRCQRINEKLGSTLDCNLYK